MYDQNHKNCDDTCQAKIIGDALAAPDQGNRTSELDAIQRNIWARINDEINLRGIKISIGDAYCLVSIIKEVLHPEVERLISQEAARLAREVLDVTPPDGVDPICNKLLKEAERRRLDALQGGTKG